MVVWIKGIHGVNWRLLTLDKINCPNPGSKEAIKQGCTCDPGKNEGGLGVFFCGAFWFYFNEDCPLHKGYFTEADWEAAKDIEGN